MKKGQLLSIFTIGYSCIKMFALMEFNWHPFGFWVLLNNIPQNTVLQVSLLNVYFALNTYTAGNPCICIGVGAVIPFFFSALSSGFGNFISYKQAHV